MYTQYDKDYADHTLGKSGTFKHDGCAVTSLTNAYNKLGGSYDPESMNDRLVDADAFDKDDKLYFKKACEDLELSCTKSYSHDKIRECVDSDDCQAILKNSEKSHYTNATGSYDGGYNVFDVGHSKVHTKDYSEVGMAYLVKKK